VANDPGVTVTDADVRALAAKLKGMHALLTPPEQALLQAVLRRAAGRGPQPPEVEDVDGPTWAVRFNPFPDLDSVAAEEFRAAPRPVVPEEEASDDDPADR
jgi:hypothetical protein